MHLQGPDLSVRAQGPDVQLLHSELAQLGMSSQLAAFGICIAVGSPLVYVWILLAQIVFVAGLFLLTPSKEVSLEHC